jgi:SlyX protein
MNSDNNHAENIQSEKINQLELMVAHLQHDYDKLNSVIIDLHKELREMNSRIEHLDGRVTTLAEGPEFRNPEEEKPPHY